MKCVKCGTKLKKGVKYCPKCGDEVKRGTNKKVKVIELLSVVVIVFAGIIFAGKTYEKIREIEEWGNNKENLEVDTLVEQKENRKDSGILEGEYANYEKGKKVEVIISQVYEDKIHIQMNYNDVYYANSEARLRYKHSDGTNEYGFLAHDITDIQIIPDGREFNWKLFTSPGALEIYNGIVI